MGRQKKLVWWLQVSAAVVLVTIAVATARLDGQVPAAAPQQGATRVDYRRDVQPILNANCVACHNGPTAPAELQLATPEGLLRGGTSGRTVIPGDAAMSLLVVRTEDRGPNRMPPNGQLTGAELATIRAWIDQGAAVDLSVDFESQVQPILRTACYSCHSGSEPRGQFALDNKEAALKGGVLGRDIVPGDPAASLLLHRVRGEGGRPRMPMVGTALTSEQIAVLDRWIQQGAYWPENAGRRVHWAYVPPQRPGVPATRDARWARNAIDSFILARLEKEALRPSPEASRETLVRRLYLDLIGLPPSPAEVDAYLADTRPDAYERIVDRLLASPQYGERMATPWLDQARYADSNGYERDYQRVAWPYRDWVVKAFNENKGFDQFTIEQLAGDLLPNASVDQKIATGFVRASMLNAEAGTDAAEQNWVAQLDRATTVGNVFLGSTIQCTQCHNHKYDPFTQKQFYQMVAFFNNAAFDQSAARGGYGLNSGLFTEVRLDIATLQQAARRDEIAGRVTQLREKLNAQTPESDALQARWTASVLAAEKDWVPLVPTKVASEGGSTLTAMPDGSVFVSGTNPGQDVYVVDAKAPVAGRITGIRLEALPDERLPRGGPGRDFYGNFIVSSMEIGVGTEGAPLSPLSIDRYPIDSVNRLSFATNLFEIPLLWRSDLTRDNIRVPMNLLAIPAAPLVATANTVFRITLNQQSEVQSVALGRFRLSVTTSATPETVVAVPYDIRPLLAIPRSERAAFIAKQKLTGGGFRGGNEGGPDAVGAQWRAVAPEMKPLRDEIAALQQQVADLKIPTALVLTENMGVNHPTTFVRERGAFTAPTEEVAADVPAFLGPLPEDGPKNRLGLARWLVDARHPLTARVRVNQIWQMIFGRGIVESAEDFGTQGVPPSHPELLDWLATEFVSTGWDQKALMRLIVTSNTYRQSSDVTSELLEHDPKNTLLARAPRFRVEAEMIRDIALTASGLLSRKMGGAPVMPPQPDGMWNLPFMLADDKWITSTGEDRFRRGLYIFVRRTVRYPSLTTFDAPSREVTIQRRNRSNTPLQALTTLNDPAFFEAAQAMARRVLKEGGADDRERITYAFRLVTSRRPRAAEQEAIAAALAQQRAQFDADVARAGSVAGGPDAQLAAWTVVANALLNLDEALTKE